MAGRRDAARRRRENDLLTRRSGDPVSRSRQRSPSSGQASPASSPPRELVAAGREVVVLEARDRVGGRVLNVEIGGEANELGGQWIAPYQSEAQALIDELGLELFHSYREGDHVYSTPTARCTATTATTIRSATAAGARVRAGGRDARRARGRARPRGAVGASARRRARRAQLRAVARRPSSTTRLARDLLRAFMAGGLHDEAGDDVLAARRARDDRRRRRASPTCSSPTSACIRASSAARS